MSKLATCNEEVECFAKVKRYICGFELTKCSALSRTDFWGKACPFAKPNREITNGKSYPFNPEEYAEMHEDKT